MRGSVAGRTYLYLLPDSELVLTCPGEGALLTLEGRLTLLPVVQRGRPVYKIVAAELTAYEYGVLLGTETGTGMFWPMLPRDLQRMTLDFGSAHFDSNYAEQNPSRELRINLENGQVICPTDMYLHLSPVATEHGIGP